MRVEIQGAVQGVGFRPFVYRLAHELSLDGWVLNDVQGVVVELEGEAGRLESFLHRVRRDKPAPSTIERLIPAWLEPTGLEGFEIRKSGRAGRKTVQMLPDIATCDDCRREVLDPGDRRCGYPFTNCTHCGPRLTIIRSLPYDRPNTSMADFTMCPACRAEYESPLDRRFHAQPNACPECGPRLELWDAGGERTAEGGEALSATVEALQAGEIVAVKGLGGFHLMVDATDAAAIARLRGRKPRREKPFALMVRDLEQARTLCDVDAGAERLLLSPEAPIVLLPRRAAARVDPGVAPDNRRLGLMLPSTPLHHLLMGRLEIPLVATSGNLSDEPICTDEREAQGRLAGVADRFLVHDRPIVRHVDDSVVRAYDGAPTILRRARGYAPRPVTLDRERPTLLAVGAHLKNAVALAIGRQVFVSQHVGDMETPQAMRAFEHVAEDFLTLYEAHPVAVVHDLHPGYVTTAWARQAVEGDGPLGGVPAIAVQHHHAHLASCLAEHGHDGRALGVIWDGTGYGTDGTVWGGEFLAGDAAGFRRAAHLRPFRMPGGEAAVREPRRSAVALLFELWGEAALERDDLAAVGSFCERERLLLSRMLARGVHAPVTTSAGRLFDGVAGLCGRYLTTSFEGQAAMALEFAADPAVRDAYPLALTGGGDDAWVLDWAELVGSVVEERKCHVPVGTIAARFHNALAAGICDLAERLGESTVVLSGGCFQNGLLIERALERLRAAGFEVLLQRRVPPNDGGIALGQIAVAAASLDRS